MEFDNVVTQGIVSKLQFGKMTSFYYKRTEEHIRRVRDNLKLIVETNHPLLDNAVLLLRCQTHDLSKWQPPEHDPYIWLTWYYKEKDNGFEYPCGVEEQIEQATYHHIRHNRHHTGFHTSPKDMTNEDVAEMICDHAAMSQELGSSLIDWTKSNTVVKDFDLKQINLIWELVYCFEK
jgi:hypothetical protein